MLVLGRAILARTSTLRLLSRIAMDAFCIEVSRGVLALPIAYALYF
jgi:hypothetical protein